MVTNIVQQQGAAKLVGLEYSIQYKNRTENKVADALSRQAMSGLDRMIHLKW